MSSLKFLIKSFIPAKIWNGFAKSKGFIIHFPTKAYEFYLINSAPLRHQKALKKVRKKARIKVVFFLIHDSIWKYEEVYKLMEKDDRFEVIILVCPYIIYGEQNMIVQMDSSFDNFKKRGYNVIKALNEFNGEWLDVKDSIKPDIIFFTNPHKLTLNNYYISNFTNYLTCYAPYNFGNSHLFHEMHNQIFHNCLWKLFAETDYHKELSSTYAENKGVNVVTTGFPGTDIFLDKKYEAKDVWKIKDKNIKRIIWAPHHTIDDNTDFLSYSAFLIYEKFMKNLLNEYKGSLQIAFKPHPLLKNKLFEHKDWGKEKTESYYDFWMTSENGQLNEGDYIDLFFTSDAMIHDSGSFLTEYLYLNKPVLHTNRDERIKERMNLFGIQSFDMHYHAKNQNDIINFVDKLLAGLDEKKVERELFFEENLMPPKKLTASENIYNEIVSNIFQK
ncbi:CDP-glycerol glycerophosphotransferase family protein [Flavobacterium aquidurense]|uniref:CDP-glycerol glycerophosphotransferase family protein n=1 Tax=Flavobacterium aquidurense TaxID=362413 RepID=UPI0037579731